MFLLPCFSRQETLLKQGILCLSKCCRSYPFLSFYTNLYGCSSNGRVMVSKTIGWEFESLHPCIQNMSKIKIYIRNLIQEVRYKITWPAYHKLQSSSVLVLVTSFIFALLIGFIDWSFKKIFVWFYTIF